MCAKIMYSSKNEYFNNIKYSTSKYNNIEINDIDETNKTFRMSLRDFFVMFIEKYDNVDSYESLYMTICMYGILMCEKHDPDDENIIRDDYYDRGDWTHYYNIMQNIENVLTFKYEFVDSLNEYKISFKIKNKIYYFSNKMNFLKRQIKRLKNKK